MPGEQDARHQAVRELPVGLDVPGGFAGTGKFRHTYGKGGVVMWSWPERGIAYGRHDGDAFDSPPALSATSLVDGQLRAWAAPLPRLLANPMGSDQQNLVVAPDRGEVYAAFGRGGHTLTELLENSSRAVDDARSACANVENLAENSTCFGGVHVLDAETLETRGRITFEPARPGGAIIHPLLRAMRYAPATDGMAAKLLMMVEDWTAGGGYVPGSGFISTYTPRRRGMNATYLVQFDVESQRQEWIFRLDACRGSREPVDTGVATGMEDSPFPGALFRTGGTEAAIFVGCFASNQTGTVVRIPIDSAGVPPMLPAEIDQGAVTSDSSEPPEPIGVAQPSAAVTAMSGPEKTMQILADPASKRLLMRTWDDFSEVWWVFDGARMAFAGTVGIGGPYHSTDGVRPLLDEQSGRLYVFATETDDFSGGLLIADIRRDPLPQALIFPDYAWRLDGSNTLGFFSPFLSREEDGAVRIYARLNREDRLRIIEDRLPSGADFAIGDFAGRTLDLEELDGVTSATVDGAARGFGARAILLAGAAGVARAGALDPIGAVISVGATGGRENSAYDNYGYPRGNPCLENNRELILGMVGPDSPMVVDASGSRASARPVITDSATRADPEAPVSRCTQTDWDGLWTQALFGSPPMSEPTAPWVLGEDTAACISTGGGDQDSTGDVVLQRFRAAAQCDGDESQANAYARGFDFEGVQVGEVLSSARVYRDPARGMVSRVESVTRGIDIDGVLRIDSARGTAESWANGRRQPIPEAEREEGYDPNCDFERSAGTCFTRHLFGVRTPAWSCGPCGDEQRLMDAVNRALGSNGSAAFREPNPKLARGSENGYIAAVQKPDGDRFADLVLNNDLLPTVVPVIEIIRYAHPNRPIGGGGPRGKQVYQFAGVEVSSSYGIQCLLVYDEATNTCAEPALPSGSLTVSLADPAGEPLAGGLFEVRADTDADGVVGLVDELVGESACVTAADGVGTCTFTDLEPGSYLVSQTAAPAGYSTVAEPWVSQVAPGEARTVTFTNVSNVSVIEVSAVDADDEPVEGATFAVFPDPDADGKVASDAQAAVTCTTDASGVCAMQVPAGSYVLVQTVAPAGLEPIEPVAFAFASGGQTAAVGVTNSQASGATADAPPPQASPVYSPPGAVAPPVESISDAGPPVAVVAPDTAGPALSEQVGGTVVRVIRAPGDALRLLSRDPLQALAWIASLVLFTLALLAVRRRHLLGTLTATPTAFAFVGGGPTTAPPRPRPAGPSTERAPVVAGAAPTPVEQAHPTVVLLTSSPVVAARITQPLATAEDITMLSTVDSVDQLRSVLSDRQPDVLITDLAALGADGDVSAALAGLHRPDRTVGLIPSTLPLEDTVRRCVEAGLAGVLAVDGDIGSGHLAYAIRQVAAGNPCYGPTAQRALLSAHTLAGRWGTGVSLTERETEIAVLAAQGVRRAEIAKRLFLSDGTIKWHLRSIRAKLGVTNPWDLAELRDRMREHGISDQPPRS